MAHHTFMYGQEAVSVGHYLATAARFEIMAQGGSAVDGRVPAGLALALLLGGARPLESDLLPADAAIRLQAFV